MCSILILKDVFWHLWQSTEWVAPKELGIIKKILITCSWAILVIIKGSELMKCEIFCFLCRLSFRNCSCTHITACTKRKKYQNKNNTFGKAWLRHFQFYDKLILVQNIFNCVIKSILWVSALRKAKLITNWHTVIDQHKLCELRYMWHTSQSKCTLEC